MSTEKCISSKGAENYTITGLELVPYKASVVEKLEERSKLLLDSLSKLLREFVKNVIVESRKSFKYSNFDSSRSYNLTNSERVKQRQQTTLIGEVKVSFINNVPMEFLINIDVNKLAGQYTFAERLSDWSIESRKRVNGHCDAYYRHIKSKTKFRSYKEVVNFLVYEQYPKPLRTDQKSPKKVEQEKKRSDPEGSTSRENPKSKRQTISREEILMNNTSMANQTHNYSYNIVSSFVTSPTVFASPFAMPFACHNNYHHSQPQQPALINQDNEGLRNYNINPHINNNNPNILLSPIFRNDNNPNIHLSPIFRNDNNYNNNPNIPLSPLFQNDNNYNNNPNNPLSPLFQNDNIYNNNTHDMMIQQKPPLNQTYFNTFLNDQDHTSLFPENPNPQIQFEESVDSEAIFDLLKKEENNKGDQSQSNERNEGQNQEHEFDISPEDFELFFREIERFASMIGELFPYGIDYFLENEMN